MRASLVALLCFAAQAALAADYAPIPPGISFEQLYSNLGPLSQFAQGYGDNSGPKVERIDNQPVELPTMENTQQGQDQVIDHMFPSEQAQNRVDKTKEIHNYQTQKKITNVNNRVLHRYLKEFLVNTVYNTNLQKVNHAKILNLLLTSLQETHQPKLLVKYSRQDTLNNLGDRNEAPLIENQQENKVMPAVFLPATAEKIGYDGLALGGDVSASSASAMNAAALAKLGQRTNLPTGLNYNNYQTLGSDSGSSSGSYNSGSYQNNNNGGLSGIQTTQQAQDQQQVQKSGYNVNGEQQQQQSYQSGQRNGGLYNQNLNNQQSQSNQNNQNNDNSQQQDQQQQQQNGQSSSDNSSNQQDSSNNQQQDVSNDATRSNDVQQKQQVGAYMNRGQSSQKSTGYLTNSQKIMIKHSQASANLKETCKITPLSTRGKVERRSRPTCTNEKR